MCEMVEFSDGQTQGAQGEVVNGLLARYELCFRNVQGLGVAILNPWM
jgi:hypothetical protein